LFSAHALTELSKDKPSIKQVENHSSNFLKKLEAVESSLIDQLKYLAQVSTGDRIPPSCSTSIIAVYFL
jgi:mediator of RNA polymerase II transcription subunit 11